MSLFTCHMSRVTCHVSYVMCHMSYVMCHMSYVILFIYLLLFFFIFLDKVVKLFGGGSVISGAYPVYFITERALSDRLDVAAS